MNLNVDRYETVFGCENSIKKFVCDNCKLGCSCRNQKLDNVPSGHVIKFPRGHIWVRDLEGH